jgi:hypothetical protein
MSGVDAMDLGRSLEVNPFSNVIGVVGAVTAAMSEETLWMRRRKVLFTVRNDLHLHNLLLDGVIVDSITTPDH